MHRIRRLFELSIIACSSLFAVGPTGTIVGTVTDPSDRIVQQARVLVRNQGTNAIRETVTAANGEYSVPLLLPGSYEVAVEAPNFRRAVYPDVKVEVNATVRVDAVLQIGELAQKLVVTAAQPLTQPDTSALGTVVNQQAISGLPLNERNFLLFTLLVPGAQLPAEGSQNSSQGAAVSVNGAREQSNNFLLDGVDNNDSSINSYTTLPSVEAIQEFQVQSSNSSAEFGRSAGAQINAVLKSGTNRFHGDAFEFFRNRNLDAKNYFDQPDCTAASVAGTCAAIPRLDRNQYGGTLGGPIVHDKTFFFAAYEGLHQRQGITREATVPSQDQLDALYAMVPSSQRDPAGVNVLKLLPAANVGPDLAGSNLFVASPVLRNQVHQITGKIDQYFGETNILTGHYSIFDENRFNPYDPFFAFTALPGYGSESKNRGQNAGISWVHTFNARLINEARLGFSRLRAGILQQNQGNDLSSTLGFPNFERASRDLGYPNVLIAGFDGVGEPTNTPQQRVENTWHVAENLAWSPSFGGGRHRFKFGADVRSVQLNFFFDVLARGEFLFTGMVTGNPLLDLLYGIPVAAVATQGDSTTSFRSVSQDYFVQDDIRVTPRFTLNLGLRYEFNSAPVEEHNRMSVPDLSANSAACSPMPNCQFFVVGTHGVPRGIFSPSAHDFAPRIGFSWNPLPSNRFVVRSAYGIFYDVNVLNINVGPRFNPPFFSDLIYPNTGMSTTETITQQPGLASVMPFLIASNFRDGYLQQWNFDLQYETLPGLVLDAAYVGSKGTHLVDDRNLNQPAPGGNAPYAQFADIGFYESGASSIYHSLQLRAEKRWSNHLTFLAAYTWSKSIDNSSGLFGTASDPEFPQNSNDMRAERGLSNFDTRHRFVGSYLYEIPSRIGWLQGWNFSGIFTFQTGQPFTVNRGIDQSGTGNTSIAFSDRPDEIADPFRAGPVLTNPDAACHTTISQGGLAADRVRVPGSWFNPCAFAAAPGRFGDAGRNSVTGPGFENIDFALLKQFRLPRERARFEFRAEAFNLLNHPNFDIPNRIFDSPSFGRVTSANAFGGRPSRQIQLSLKFLF